MNIRVQKRVVNKLRLTDPLVHLRVRAKPPRTSMLRSEAMSDIIVSPCLMGTGEQDNQEEEEEEE